MELRAVYEALKIVPADVSIELQTDSTYVIKIFTEWVRRWEANNWRTSDRKRVSNVSAIQQISHLLVGRDIVWQHVPGHAGHVLNEIADRKARAAATAVRDGKQPHTGQPSCARSYINAWQRNRLGRTN